MTRAALVCAALALIGGIYAFKAAEKMPDFEVYWRAGERAARAEPLYRPDDGHYRLKYIPAFAMLAIPFAWFPLPVAKAIWFALSVAVLCAFVAMSVRLLPERRTRAWIVTLCVVLAMAKFYGHELVLGQVNLLLGALVTAAVHLLRGGRDTMSGVLLAIATVVKPYAIIFIPWLAAAGRGRAMLTAVGAVAGALALPATVYGVSGAWLLHVEWWRTVTESTGPNLLNADNVSIAAMFAKWLGPGGWSGWLAVLTSIALVVVAGDVMRRRAGLREPLGLEAALLLTALPLWSPQGWDYVLLLATPAVAFLVNYEDRLPRGLRVATAVAVATAAFSLFDIMGRRTYGAFMALSVVTVCFLVVIGALHTLRTRRVA